ncbi:hypothetical protein ACHAPU_001320 [Fusarium lateritium]
MDNNPEIIQPADWRAGQAVPVFLIHDGGGTTFSYHCLEPLHRPVYGIHNPSFHSGVPFEGELKDMARLYCGFIKEAVEEPDFPKRRNAEGKIRILLGGWSLGGSLSLEIAKQLDSDNANIEVIGILMIDTIYPHKFSSKNRRGPGEGTKEGRSKNQILADIAMADARCKLQAWDAPVWDGATLRPRIHLLRAKEPVPVQDNKADLVDVTREERNLGWDMYEKDLFAEVVDIDGHHYEIFMFQYLEDISKTMKESLDKLERVALQG